MSRRDLDFNLFEVLGVDRLISRERFKEHDHSVFEQVLNTAQDIAAEFFQSHYRLADVSEPHVQDGKVVTLVETATAVREFVDAGFMRADRAHDRGGMQLPFAIVQASYGCFQAANLATTSYPFLTAAAVNVIENYSSAEIRERYVEPMLDGRFLGTMCLSEPQAGSSLADIRTRATVQEGGGFLIRGTKMWISAGDHEMSENIVHLVLARIDGAPAGVKGISMFVVPKRKVDAAGRSGDMNGVRLMGLNHKMGWRGIVNTSLSFGEHDDCIGLLVGEPNCGLAYMFQMMNEARISVGLGATMMGYAGYLYSLDYARTRTQGRLPGDKDPKRPPVAIVEHADVRRLLLAQKANVEGALSLCLYAAYLVDEIRTHPEVHDRREAELVLDLITPVVKAWPSEFCLEANKHAMQVLGGYGYTRDYLVEQLYRDNRLNAVHEGTNGIQAVDLMGRKVLMHRGGALVALERFMKAEIETAAGHERLREFAGDLGQALTQVMEVTNRLAPGAKDDPVLYLANASLYADAFGHVLIGWMWLRQARTAADALAAGASQGDRSFYEGKLAACRYFYRYELPRIEHWLRVVSQKETAVLDTDPQWL